MWVAATDISMRRRKGRGRNTYSSRFRGRKASSSLNDGDKEAPGSRNVCEGTGLKLFGVAFEGWVG